MINMDRYRQAEWLEWSGLPLALNQVRSGAWPVFKKLIELDCEAHAQPAAVEVSLAHLAARCGLTPEATVKILDALRRKKYLRCYLPEQGEEPGLFEIQVPIQTPIAPADVARAATDPQLRNPGLYRYAQPIVIAPEDDRKTQQVVDLYLDHLSQNVNSFVLEQIQVAARRFPLEDIRRMIERGERHNIRSMGWVLKELIREQYKQAKTSK